VVDVLVVDWGTGTYDMEGVEEDADDFMYESPLRTLDVIPEPGVGMDEEAEDDLIDGSYFAAPQSALPHSLPAHLHLDPVKMQQMRALFFAEGRAVLPVSALVRLRSWV
jgi:hypothetical protein